MKFPEESLRALRAARRFRVDVAPFRGAIVLAVGLQLASVLLELVRPWTLQQIIDRALVAREPGAERIVIVGAAFLGLIVLARVLMDHLGSLRVIAANHAVTRAIRLRTYRHLIGLPPSYHTDQKPGDLLVRLMGDAPMVSTMLVEARVNLITRAIQIVATVGLMVWIDLKLTLSLALFLPAVLFAAHFLSGRLTIATRKQRRKEGEMADMMQESLMATPVIQSLGRETHAVRSFAKNNRRSARAGLKSAKAAQRLASTVEALLGTALGVTVALGGLRVLDPTGDFSLGELIAYLSYVRGVMKPMRSASKHQARIARGTACAERLASVLDQDVPVRTSAGSEQPARRPSSLVFDGVGFEYANGRTVLEHLDLEVRAGEVVAVAGESGAGKSTIAALAMRLMDPVRGEVRLDGVPLNRYEVDALRERFALSMQTTVLFGASIRENLLLGRLEATDDELWEALNRAAAADFVSELPEALDFVLGAAGSRLSGGQRRRICLARAFLRGAPILVVDEPFAGLDARAAAVVEESLRAHAREGGLVLVIAHEHEGVERFDRSVRLCGGKVMEISRPPAPREIGALHTDGGAR